MCNLYSQTRLRDEVMRTVRVADNRAAAFDPLPSIFPRSIAPVIRPADDGERELVPMTWGFPLLRKGYAPKFVTNVRDDKILDSKRPSFLERRCLVPASSYCEPNGESPATWFWLALKGEAERPLFAFPGIWKRYCGPLKKDSDPVEVDVYSFLTTEPNELTRSINHERMPVLLAGEEACETCLKGTPAERFSLVRSFDPAHMRIVQSGKEKKDLVA